MQIPASICKRIAKRGEAPLCRQICHHCPCVGVVRGVYRVLGGDPIDHLEDGLPEPISALLKTNGDRVWLLFGAGGEMIEQSGLVDGCDHIQRSFHRPLPEGFMEVDDSEL